MAAPRPGELAQITKQNYHDNVVYIDYLQVKLAF